MSFIYLASPYSDPNLFVRAKRYHAASTATAWLLHQRLWTYSPIVHCHPLAVSYCLPTDAAFWQAHNFAMLDRADKLLILTIPGWKKSRGVTAETEYAIANRIPINWLSINPYAIKESQ